MKNNINYYYLFFLIFSFIYPSSQAILSYELKFSEGKGDSRNYFENLLDINYFFNSGLYLFAQIEYSSPPLLGSETKALNDITNIFYLQHSSSKYDLTLGNLYLLYGRGLSLHTYQDQDIDYDNSLKGIDFNYHINDNIDLFLSLGTNEVKSRTNPADIEPSISIDNDIISIGSTFNYNNINFHYLSMIYDQSYAYDDINNLKSLSNILGDYLTTLSGVISEDNPGYDMTNIEHNLGMEFVLGPIDFYVEKSLVFYDKLLAERVDGYKNYFSTYMNIFDFNIIYEYKDYSTPYLYNIFSTPPIAFREASSILSSRNLHTIDFSNEYGYHLEINRSFDNSLNFLASYAFALHHNEDQNDPNVFDFSISLDDFLELSDYFPYKQYYVECSNWNKNGKFYYRIGYDYFYEITNLKTIKAQTVPMQYVYSFKTGNSLTFYLELQEKIVASTNTEHKYFYFSPSYNHFGSWLLTFFADIEQESDKWYALDVTKNFKNSSQISLFYGSQKGGLVCANGSCVMQPDFEDGFKVTYRTNF